MSHTDTSSLTLGTLHAHILNSRTYPLPLSFIKKYTRAHLDGQREPKGHPIAIEIVCHSTHDRHNSCTLFPSLPVCVYVCMCVCVCGKIGHLALGSAHSTCTFAIWVPLRLQVKGRIIDRKSFTLLFPLFSLSFSLLSLSLFLVTRGAASTTNTLMYLVMPCSAVRQVFLLP